MEELIRITSEALDWSSAGVPYPGESISGDKACVFATPERALIATVDGAGHGLGAAAAADLATRILAQHAMRPVRELLLLCHEEMAASRGAAMSLASLNLVTGELLWAGVGDVAGVVLQSDERHMLVSTPGIVGFGRVASIRVEALCLRPGDLLVFATDGLDPSFFERIPRLRVLAVKEVAVELLHGFAKRTDDALVVVARYLGGAS